MMANRDTCAPNQWGRYFPAGSWGMGVMAFLGGAFAVICGILVLFDPLRGLAALTLVLAIYFVIDGIQRIVLAFRLRPVDGWGWVLFGGLLSILLGVLIWSRWPLSGVWAVGTLVGIHILFGGWTMIAITMAARRVAARTQTLRSSSPWTNCPDCRPRLTPTPAGRRLDRGGRRRRGPRRNRYRNRRNSVRAACLPSTRT